MALGICPVYGQDKTDDWNVAVALVKSAGPYEVKGESGVIGFVVAWAGDVVTFKPCTGDSFSLDRKKLLFTKNKCADSPSSNENPLVASCNNALKWDVQIVAEAVRDDGPIGKTFFKKAGAAPVTVVMADPKQAAATVDAAYQLKDCGQYVVGFDKYGSAMVGLVPSIQAIQLDDSK
ncbi:hypothetical protein [Mesorhizobium sp. M4A.F.Ca.ET.090.04.2.1]|uniref:hypothetical protein n=1 Tax=Mesorhizobium sp. M4A.F.Ca.ET.090.04.2.1 TaxID=2496663 RepID=UPI001AECB1D6|nr:hypothetical protein [Mesorhizobium sp. M4A.F.Ca.ET.090.04.2.1]